MRELPYFWMVWREGSSQPKYKHDTKQSAEKEAERLSRQNPGERFYVLKAKSVYQSKVSQPERQKLREPVLFKAPY